MELGRWGRDSKEKGSTCWRQAEEETRKDGTFAGNTGRRGWKSTWGSEGEGQNRGFRGEGREEKGSGTEKATSYLSLSLVESSLDQLQPLSES